MKSSSMHDTMIRMKAPTNSGGSISIAGMELDCDEDGCVEVSPQFRAELESHGFVAVADKAAVAAKHHEAAKKR